jgi:hypothetical protein
MNRSGDVTAAAIVLFFGSGLLLIMLLAIPAAAFARILLTRIRAGREAGNIARKRSIGVTLAAAVVLLYGMAFLITSVDMFRLVFQLHPGQNARMLRAVALPVLRLSAIEVGLFATSWGLFCLRRWARWSILSIATGMVGLGAYAWISTYLGLPNHGMTGKPSLFDSALGLSLVTMLLLVLPGTWWLVLFTRPSVEAQFANKTTPPPETAVSSPAGQESAL